MNKLLTAISLAVLSAPIAPAQLADYLDVFVAQVKPERRADFDAMCRQVADTNRKPKGDKWIAMENVYGAGNTVFFVSQRANYAAVEQGFQAFDGTMIEAVGPEAWKKMGQDFNSMLVSSRSELRRRRWDLSINAPKDPESESKMVGAARWIRTQEVRVNPGHQTQFERQVMAVKALIEKNSPSWTVLVSQVVAGEPSPLYYLSTLQPSLAGFDASPDIHKLMGDEAFAAWEKANADVVVSAETRIMRIIPELSSPPSSVEKESTGFWQPKPAGAAKPEVVPMPSKKGSR